MPMTRIDDGWRLCIYIVIIVCTSSAASRLAAAKLGRYTIHIISYLRGGPTSSYRFIATRHAYTARGLFGRPTDRPTARPPGVYESRRHRRRDYCDDRIRSLSRVRPTSAADCRRAGPLLESHKIYDNDIYPPPEYHDAFILYALNDDNNEIYFNKNDNCIIWRCDHHRRRYGIC